MRRIPIAAALVGFLCFAAPARGEDDPAASQLVERAAPVVSIKSVVRQQYEDGVGDNERTITSVGILVDPSGVVMFTSWTSGYSPGFAEKIRILPKSMRVTFEGDEKEYDAVLGKTDSTLGLSFCKIKDLAGRKVTAVDFSTATEAKLGTELVCYTRTDQGFDFAPYFGTAKVVGQVHKPRTMWIVQGFLPVSHPIYHEDGHVAGIVVRQSGVSSEDGMFGGGGRLFLLPAKASALVVALGVKSAAQALDDVNARAAKDEAEAKREREAKAAAPPAMSDK